MKLVVALALPAAALRPVQVTMSAAQNRRAFVIGGTAAAASSDTRVDKQGAASDIAHGETENSFTQPRLLPFTYDR